MALTLEGESTRCPQCGHRLKLSYYHIKRHFKRQHELEPNFAHQATRKLFRQNKVSMKSGSLMALTKNVYVSKV